MSNESLLPVILIQLCCYSYKDSNGTKMHSIRQKDPTTSGDNNYH